MPNDPSIALNFEFYTKRPLLNFEIQGFYSEAERAELVAEALEETLLSEWNKRPEPVREPYTRERPRILRQLANDTGIATQDTEGNSLPLEEIESSLLETVAIEDDALLELASERASSVQKAMIAKGFAANDLSLLAPQETDELKAFVRLGIRP